MCRLHQSQQGLPVGSVSRIDQIVNSTAECDLLCFLDAFSGYHQIKMAVEDVEKMAFQTPCGVYCYTCVPFGLRNAGATFQRLMHITFGRQLGRTPRPTSMTSW